MKSIIPGNTESPKERCRFGKKKNLNAIRTIDLESPCGCGGLKAKFGAGRKPGESSLLCDKCGVFITWINERQIKALLKGGES